MPNKLGLFVYIVSIKTLESMTDNISQLIWTNESHKMFKMTSQNVTFWIRIQTVNSFTANWPSDNPRPQSQFWGPTKWHCFMEGAWSMPSLIDLVAKAKKPEIEITVFPTGSFLYVCGTFEDGQLDSKLFQGDSEKSENIVFKLCFNWLNKWVINWGMNLVFYHSLTIKIPHPYINMKVKDSGLYPRNWIQSQSIFTALTSDLKIPQWKVQRNYYLFPFWSRNMGPHLPSSAIPHLFLVSCVWLVRSVAETCFEHMLSKSVWNLNCLWLWTAWRGITKEFGERECFVKSSNS